MQNCSNPFRYREEGRKNYVKKKRFQRNAVFGGRGGNESLRYLEDFEAVDIQHTNQQIGVTSLLLQSIVDLADDPIEHPRVNGLGEGIPSGGCLLDILRHVVGGHLLGTRTSGVQHTEQQTILKGEGLHLEELSRKAKN